MPRNWRLAVRCPGGELKGNQNPSTFQDKPHKIYIYEQEIKRETKAGTARSCRD